MDTKQRARQLILEFGWNSTAYQILNPGIQHWFSAAVPAVAGFVPRGRTLVVAGAPICAPETLGLVTNELERYACSQGRRICYVAAAGRLEEHFRDSPNHSRIALGAQPIWNPQSWTDTLKSRSSMRGQIARAKNKGVKITAKAPMIARHDALLRRCLEKWLSSRPLPPMRFLVEPDALKGELTDRVLLVAEQHNVPIAFLMASPIPRRNGFLVEQIIRFPEAPNGTAELLIDGVMRQLAAGGSSYLTMGLVPLAIHANGWLRKNPLWLRVLTACARTHGQRFYHFDGLEQFRAKMCPTDWEPIYAITNERNFTISAMHAMLAALTDGPLTFLVAKAVGRAITIETLRLAGSAVRRLHRNGLMSL